ncbi:hypothetical protein B0H15DRAFT_952155 [Mycena belliarum]|uniref:Uncharacterized protein n=1 Tax=Mycena belliarum TaxID=1033014 RepID=A0AAD6U0Z1_9AGAR|nr:hypothetical protein B0H15DRAFT_952155 [Mycena belliae]
MDLKREEMILRRNDMSTTDLNIYDESVVALERLGKHNLAAHDIGVTFERQTTGDDERKFTSYVNLENHKIFSAYILAEVGSEAEGTWLAAYPKKMPPSKLPLTDDSTAQRMVIAARCPSGAPKKLAEAFQDFMAVLDTIRADDQDEETKKRENFQVTEWANRSDGDLLKPYDIMILRLLQLPTYERVPTKGSQETSSGVARRPRNKKSSTQEDVSMEPSVGVSPTVDDRKIGDTYHPNMLPDHRGPYFDHRDSKLVQRDYIDRDHHLIAPHELYEKLTEGTLFSAQISLHTFSFGGRVPNKIYHIYVEKLQIHDLGYGEIWKPSIPSIPSSSTPASPQKRFKMEKDEEVNKASDAFSSMSPSKKVKT